MTRWTQPISDIECEPGWTQLLPKFFLFIIIKKTSVKSSHHKRRPSVYGWHNSSFDAWKQLKFLPSKSLLCPWIWIVKLVFIEKVFEIYLFNRSWHISTTPNTTNFFTILKPIQQSNLVILSCPLQKNQNLNLREKKFRLLLEVEFSSQKRQQTSIFGNNPKFFPQVQILIFLCEETQNDHIRLLY